MHLVSSKIDTIKLAEDELNLDSFDKFITHENLAIFTE